MKILMLISRFQNLYLATILHLSNCKLWCISGTELDVVDHNQYSFLKMKGQEWNGQEWDGMGWDGMGWGKIE
jgi:hypothetical protein